MIIMMDVETLTPIIFHCVPVDVPDEIAEKGKDAILKWMKRNVSLIDGMCEKREWQESTFVKEVTGCQMYD